MNYMVHLYELVLLFVIEFLKHIATEKANKQTKKQEEKTNKNGFDFFSTAIVTWVLVTVWRN